MTTSSLTVESPVTYNRTRFERNWDTFYGTDVTVENSSYDGVIGIGWQNDIRTTWSDTDWRAKIALGQNASLPYRLRRISIQPAEIACHIEFNIPFTPNWRNGQSAMRWAGIPPEGSLDVDDPALADSALAKVKKKMNNRTQSYNTIIPAAELKELRMTIVGAATITDATMRRLYSVSAQSHRFRISDSTKRAYQLVNIVKGIKRADFRRAWREASDIWLTYSFGIAPMMRTISDINKSISAYLTRYDSVDRLTGSASKDWIGRTYDDTIAGCDGAMVMASGYAYHQLSYKYVVGHKFDLMSANDYGAMDHFGFKPASLIPAAWELMAFSWVLDYFTTAGQFLDDTFTGTTGNSVYVIKNRRYRVSSRCTLAYFKIHPGANTRIWYQRPGVSTMQAFEFQRSVMDSLPGRALRFRTFDEIGNNAVSKLLNLTSILSKSFR